MKVSIECPVCGKQLQREITPAFLKSKTHCCSQQCAGKIKPRRKPLSNEERFWSHVHKTDHCWIWTARLGRGGYGQFHVYDEDGFHPIVAAHRFSYQLHKGIIPEGMLICHDCIPLPDNPRCIRPDHLWLGTYADNTADAVVKGRMPKGESHNLAKLTEDQVREIRRLFATGKFTKMALSKQFGVNDRSIGNVVLLKNWTHVV